MVSSLSQKCFICYDNSLHEFVIDHSREGWVYIIRAVGTNRIKLGFSKNPERRILELQSPQMPFKLELVYKQWFLDAYALEQHLHEVFKDFNVNGEWFEIPIETEVCEQSDYRINLNIADKWCYSKSKYYADKTPKESVLISIGLDFLKNKTMKPIVMECLNDLAQESGASDTGIWDSLCSALNDSIITAIISPCIDKSRSHPFSTSNRMLVDNLNTSIRQLFDTARYGDDMGFNGENLSGNTFLAFAVGVLSGILNAYSCSYDTIEDIRLELSTESATN